jgi:diguanylate cyclase (GGDEF)-like protein
MNHDQKPGTQDDEAALKTLNKALEQSEQVKGLLDKATEELESVNVILKQQFADHNLSAEIKNALEKNEAIEKKVEEASDKLIDVTLALDNEVRSRNMLDHQYAAIKEQEEAARHASLHDILTGLPNRSLFNDRLEHSLAQALRQDGTLAVLFMDLDKFKNINDTHGHVAGDSVLKIIAGRIKEHTRDVDTICRQSGDEFLFLLTDIGDYQNIKLIVEKLINELQAPCKVKAYDINIILSIKVSIGIAIFRKDGSSSMTLINRADEAMYRAKQDKSGYAFAGKSHQREILDNVQ